MLRYLFSQELHLEMLIRCSRFSSSNLNVRFFHLPSVRQEHMDHGKRLLGRLSLRVGLGSVEVSQEHGGQYCCYCMPTLQFK